MNEELDFCIIITTYNRPDMLYKLLKDIESKKNNYKIKIFIFNDGSTENYDLSEFDVTHLKFFPNRGKKKYWEIINQTFNVVKSIKSKYYLYLPDDVMLIDDFFNELIRVYRLIDDKNKICLNILTDGRVNRTNWTNFNSIHYDEYIKTQWNDLCFLADSDFFSRLNYEIKPVPLSRWNGNSNLSSGVGQQISLRLYNMNLNMYHTKKSFVYHGNHESKMNKVERVVNNLTTN